MPLKKAPDSPTGSSEGLDVERAKAFAKDVLWIPSDPDEEPANLDEVRLAEDVFALAEMVEQLRLRNQTMREARLAALASVAGVLDTMGDDAPAALADAHRFLATGSTDEDAALSEPAEPEGG